MPSRRRTQIGKGAFGASRAHDDHAREVLRRILSRRLPLTEDAVFLCVWHQLKTKKESHILRNVRASKAILVDGNPDSYLQFSPDVDILEVTKRGKVIGYELKGERKLARSITPPKFYEGYDQAMALLMNPVIKPPKFTGSIFDEVWLVHPSASLTGSDRRGSFENRVVEMAALVREFSPVGFMRVSHTGIHIESKAGINPYLNPELKAHFIQHLDKFQTYEKFTVKPIQ